MKPVHFPEVTVSTRPPQDLGPIFAQSSGSENVTSSHEVRAGRLHGETEIHPKNERVNRPDDHARLAGETDDGEKLLELATRAANAILDAQGWVTVGLVRVHLEREQLLANDGKERLDALGALGRRMGLVSVGVERQPKELGVTHGNRGTVWVRPSRVREYFEEHRPSRGAA